MVEQPDRDKAISYQDQTTIKLFHGILVSNVYDFLKLSCERFGRGECKETPKIVCLRSVRDFPPVQCVLYDKGYFPLTVDKKFVDDVAFMEIDSLKPAKKLTEKHGRRFIRMFRNKTFRLGRIKRKPPGDPSETIIE